MSESSETVGPQADKISSKDASFKIFNDPIHGHIELNDACVAIMDTPEFQRLRFLKQLGCCYFVYPGASHNRFEHSIGVCHLAGKMVRSLRSRQGLGITDKDVLCVEIAGLCHDLGHGPFSHLFDGNFIPKVNGKEKWKHEKASLVLVERMLKNNDALLEKCHLENEDIEFIKELIDGPKEEEDKVWPYVGRSEDKAFLYQIIANKKTGIDVDKWDYLARDCHHLGYANNFDHKRYVNFVRVLKVGDRLEICLRDKEIGNIYQMFVMRYNLFRTAYQHKVVQAVEMMVVDALVLANDHLKFPGENNRMLTLSETINDMKAYALTTDNILWMIYRSQEKELETAKKIVERIFRRDLYRCLIEHPMPNSVTLMDLTTEMMNSDQSLDKDDFFLKTFKIDFGMGDKDPLSNLWFYSKASPDTPTKASTAGLIIPEKFKYLAIRVFSRKNDEVVDKRIKESFKKVCDAHQ